MGSPDHASEAPLALRQWTQGLKTTSSRQQNSSPAPTGFTPVVHGFGNYGKFPNRAFLPWAVVLFQYNIAPRDCVLKFLDFFWFGVLLGEFESSEIRQRFQDVAVFWLDLCERETNQAQRFHFSKCRQNVRGDVRSPETDEVKIGSSFQQVRYAIRNSIVVGEKQLEILRVLESIEARSGDLGARNIQMYQMRNGSD